MDDRDEDDLVAGGGVLAVKAAVYRRYGPPEVVHIEDVEDPVPAEDEVLVRIVASTVCAADWRLRKPDPPPVAWFVNGFPRPKKTHILGMEFAGTVTSTGRDVTRFKVGDRVFGSTGFRFGAHAEYVCLPQDRHLTRMPDSADFDEFAAIPFGGISALHFLKQAGIKAGQRVLIYGASGSVGTAAVQLARHFGAQVTGVCSTANLELVSSLGAADLVDYTRDDFSKAGPVYDIIYDTVGKSGVWRGIRALRRGGVYVLSGPVWTGLNGILGASRARMTGAGRVIGGVAQGGIAPLEFLRDLVERREFMPVIDRHFPLVDIAEAHRYAEAGHKRGNVIIDIQPKPGE